MSIKIMITEGHLDPEVPKSEYNVQYLWSQNIAAFLEKDRRYELYPLQSENKPEHFLRALEAYLPACRPDVIFLGNTRMGYVTQDVLHGDVARTTPYMDIPSVAQGDRPSSVLELKVRPPSATQFLYEQGYTGTIILPCVYQGISDRHVVQNAQSELCKLRGTAQHIAIAACEDWAHQFCYVVTTTQKILVDTLDLPTAITDYLDFNLRYDWSS